MLLMRVDVVTIFPGMFPGVLDTAMLGRAQGAGHLRIQVHDLRDYTRDKRRTVDDRPYGGGPGMVMKPEPIFEAVEAIKQQACAAHGMVPQLSATPSACQTILMSPQGSLLTAAMARQLAVAEHLIIICGRYEGVDERVRQALVDRAISIGDYVLTGGELPAMVLIDALARFIPGVIGHAQATDEESFAAGWLEYPQYTRPRVFRGMAVPNILQSGDHEEIARWRKVQAVAMTLAARPDLRNFASQNF